MEQATQENKINPLSRGYVHWHILNRFKSQIEDVMHQVELQSEGFESIPEENLIMLMAPISTEIESFLSHLTSVQEMEDSKEDE